MMIRRVLVLGLGILETLRGRTRTVVTGAACALLTASLVAAGQQPAGAALTPQDVAEIRQLSEKYSDLLGACSAAEYSQLFTADGFFASGFRGKIVGHENLMALVRSERHCMPATGRSSGGQPAAAPRPRLVPELVLEPTTDGASGKGSLPGTAGAYEDTYVKTPQGWKFRSRTHLTTKELAERSGAR
jgi:hypothetical protein